MLKSKRTLARAAAGVAAIAAVASSASPAMAAQSSSSCTVTWRSCTSAAVYPGYTSHALAVEIDGSWVCNTTYTIKDTRNGVVVSRGTVGRLSSTAFLIRGLYSTYTIRLDANCGGATGYLRSY